jgi:hypothetical protein
MAPKAIALALLLPAAFATAASADGLPVFGTGGGAAVSTPDHRSTYIARPSGSDTVITESGESTGSLRIHGQFGVPLVAYDGTASGLAADRSTLVLIRPPVAFPQTLTQLALLDARTLHVRSYLSLHGDFSVDAISPNGRWIYLIQYMTPNNTSDYRVRALDATTGRLLPQAIIDPHERDEQMTGSPLTRVTSPDGRWAYTLYEAAPRPFIHALDTLGLRARCIDLPAGTDANAASLRLDGPAGRLFVTVRGRRVATIDTATLTPARSSSATAPGPLPILALVLAVIAALATATRASRRAKRRPQLR